MNGEEVASHYEVIFKEEKCLIFGRDVLSGEEICFENLHFDKKTAEEMVFVLNKNKVSLCQAKDVIRDKIFENFI